MVEKVLAGTNGSAQGLCSKHVALTCRGGEASRIVEQCYTCLFFFPPYFLFPFQFFSIQNLKNSNKMKIVYNQYIIYKNKFNYPLKSFSFHSQ